LASEAAGEYAALAPNPAATFPTAPDSPHAPNTSRYVARVIATYSSRHSSSSLCVPARQDADVGQRNTIGQRIGQAVGAPVLRVAATPRDVLQSLWKDGQVCAPEA
jgi:hypothetical protein